METRKPVWGKVATHVFLWFLVIMIALLSGCGVRKSNVKIDSSDVKEKNDISTQIKESSKEETKTSEEEKKVDKSVHENTETTTTTEYDKDTGKPSKTTTTTKTGKTTKDVSKDRKSSTVIVKWKFRDIHHREVKRINTHTFSKDKDTERSWNFVDQVGGPFVVILIVLIIIGAIFAFKFFKP